jgi:hypothetical protein
LPSSSATPYSVTITSTWCRGVVITAPGPNHGTIRECSSPSLENVDGRQISERSESSSPAPATKSSAPPIPLNWLPLMASATTWPWMSIASAPLIEIMSSLAPITSS